MMFCRRKWPVALSGGGTSATTCRTSSAKSFGTSVSSMIRARVSSLRFVSCVDSDVIACGHSPARSSCSKWNSAAPTPKRPGAPPTSCSATSLLAR